VSQVVIRAEGLGKKYLIGHQASRERYVALRDVLARTAKGFLLSARDMLRGRQLVAGGEIEEFWAVKDVDFEIKRGEVVGLIGRNGAGKSTLLKILSRITEPSTGRVQIEGRVASLLEVGTGFHPELSGRENIFLNGAILGMSRAEIKRKFDEIVDFAEVEKFLDTPVKHYSSGMYVRLAFAVAAHLEPEILIVDEVLAVGDFEFQKKCLGKLQDVAGQGRTVLFVSHNLAAIGSLTHRAIVLSKGNVAFDGSTAEAINMYSTIATPAAGANCWQFDSVGKQRGKPASIIGVSVRGPSKDLPPVAGDECRLAITVLANQSVSRVRFSIGVDDQFGRRLFSVDTRKYNKYYDLFLGEKTIECMISTLMLRDGDYNLHVFMGRDFEAFDSIDGTISMRVGATKLFPGNDLDPSHGPIIVPHYWIE
jgi:lipopolysaccharide transport system ATP-binding protein